MVADRLERIRVPVLSRSITLPSVRRCESTCRIEHQDLGTDAIEHGEVPVVKGCHVHGRSEPGVIFRLLLSTEDEVRFRLDDALRGPLPGSRWEYATVIAPGRRQRRTAPPVARSREVAPPHSRT